MDFFGFFSKICKKEKCDLNWFVYWWWKKKKYCDAQYLRSVMLRSMLIIVDKIGKRQQRIVPSVRVLHLHVDVILVCRTGYWQRVLLRQSGRRFPYYMKEIRSDMLGAPRKNVISNNTYCKCGKFIDAALNVTKLWGMTVENNVEVKC